MKPSESKTEFKKRLGKPIANLTPRRALDAMFAFYAEQRAEKVDIDEEGDMLLYEWGVYSLTGPESFQINIVRQFGVIGEDEPYQLHLTLHFAPTVALRKLADGSKWCYSPDKLSTFRRVVASSAAFKAVADAKPSRVELYFEQC